VRSRVYLDARQHSLWQPGCEELIDVIRLPQFNATVDPSYLHVEQVRHFLPLVFD